MNKHQKLVQAKFLNNEEAIIKRLERIYNRSLKDITGQISVLDSSIAQIQAAYKSIGADDIGDLAAALLGKKANNMTPAEAKETLASMLQSKIYQKKYQEALEKQVSGVLDKMQVEEFKTVSDYLEQCYEDGYFGTMYDLQGQGIPLIMPLNQEAMVQAVQLDSKISKGLYTRLGEDITLLKSKITSQVSRGISSGMTFQQIAQQLAGTTRIGYNNAIRIARTEGHRIQVQSAMNACQDAKDIGADVVKQWDSTLDGRTRPSHQRVDGEIRELDEPFSNGLMFPGDPSGGAAEVINCRCALLQRARWALDDDELQTLKDRAAFFGLDKTDNFDDYKKKYLQAMASPATAPKKQYLTQKKLEQLVNDGNAQLDDLKEKFKTHSGGWTYDDIIKDFGSLESFADGYDLKVLKALQGQIDDVQKNVDDWAEKLNKKLVAAETKKLKKAQIDLQDQLDNYPVKTYSNIWKDDVTTKDWAAKQGSITAKKQYFESKLLYATDPDEIKKWKSLLDDLDDFDQQGKAYFDIQSKLNQTAADLKKLQNSGKISSKALDDAFTQDRKDAALWAKNTKTADDHLRDVCSDVWKNADKNERYAIYDYTCGSGKFNRPLSGYEKPYNEYGTGWEPKFKKGVGNVWIDYEGAGDEIRHMTNLISRSSYDEDIWLQRGCGNNAMESFLNLSPDTFGRMSESQLQQYVGQSNRMYSFTSCGVAKGKGFSGDCILNIYAPKGTQMMYAEPFSRFGNGSGLNWDGIQKQSSFGYESEMIIQRGASYTITKIEKSGGTIYIDMEVHPEQGYDLFQQDPSEWKGSTKKGR